MHELGHALAGKAFTKSPIDIHIGYPSEDKFNLFHAGKEPITIHTPFPFSGWTNLQESNSLTKNILTCLAGPLLGALTYYIFSIHETYQNYKKNNVLWKWTKLFKDALLETDIYSHLVVSLLPIYNNDGAKILKKFYPTADTNNHLYATAIEIFMKFLIQDKISFKIHTERNKKRYTLGNKEHLFMHKEIVKNGNRIFFLLTHKLLAAIKYGYDKEDFSLTYDTTFDSRDVVDIMYLILYQKYFKTIKKMYIK